MEDAIKNTGKGISKVKLDYNDSMLLLEIMGLARDGYDDYQIAEILGVAAETFGRNKRKLQADGSESQLKAVLRKARYPLTVMVENMLIKLALGGLIIKTTTTRSVTWETMPDGTRCLMETIEVTKDIPPSFNSIALWLKHHKPEVYNVQPIRVDFTTNGKETQSEMPIITEIKHIYGGALLNSNRISA